jgi:hypothetical protein
MGDDEYFNDTWKAFYHAPDDPDWTMQSYKSLCCVSSVRDYWALQNSVSDALANGMFFLMREHIFPCWDDKYNIEGGCLSMKVSHGDAADVVSELMRRALGETLLGGEAAGSWAQVNGLSVSPKRAFNIVKIWLSGPELSTCGGWQLPRCLVGSVLYTPFRKHIEADTAAPADRRRGARGDGQS